MGIAPVIARHVRQFRIEAADDRPVLPMAMITLRPDHVPAFRLVRANLAVGSDDVPSAGGRRPLSARPARPGNGRRELLVQPSGRQQVGANLFVRSRKRGSAKRRRLFQVAIDRQPAFSHVIPSGAAQVLRH
jgi:hypothetical protein